MPTRRASAALIAWRRRAVERMSRSRGSTLALVRRLPEAALREPRTQGEWSIHDVLVHIAAWEEEGIRRLRLIAQGRPHRMVWYETMAEADRYNARAVRAGHRLETRALLRRLARARDGLVRALRALPPRALADPTHGLPVTRWLREFAWTHEAAHRREMRAWWRRRQARTR